MAAEALVRRPFKRPVLLAVTAAVYLIAAWMVAPGFYDGLGPQQPYNWTSPPPEAPPGNLPPKSGHVDIKVVGGVSDAKVTYTDDGQVVVDFALPGAFDATGKTSISVDIKPVATFPTPTGLRFVTNVYLVTADAPLVKEATIIMVYSNILPAPSLIYFATDANGPWRSIGGTDNPTQGTIQATTRQLGYLAAGYPATATNQSSGGNQLLPIAVAVLILAVLVAGIPLAIVRRRRAAGEVDESDEGEATPRT